jgi:hypothetical protein
MIYRIICFALVFQFLVLYELLPCVMCMAVGCMYLDTGSLSPILFQLLWVSKSFKFLVAIILLAQRKVWGLPHTWVWHFIFFMLWCSLSIFQIVRPIPGKNWNCGIFLSCWPLVFTSHMHLACVVTQLLCETWVPRQ